MASIDLKKVYRAAYSAKVGQPVLVDLPPRPFLMVDGAGGPAGSEYADAMATIYPIAYGLRFRIKDEIGDAYTVMPLEGLWWVDNMEEFSEERKNEWKWTSLVAVPEITTQEMVDSVVAEMSAKKDLPSRDRLRFEVFDEGLSAQVMHIGPYSAEAPTIEMLHQFIFDQGKRLRGRHHEIYVGDPRRSAPEKLKTIIRQPVG